MPVIGEYVKHHQVRSTDRVPQPGNSRSSSSADLDRSMGALLQQERVGDGPVLNLVRLPLDLEAERVRSTPECVAHSLGGVAGQLG